MEKLVMSQIMKNLKRERLLHDKQYGFLPGRSTTLQLLKVLNEWTEAVDKEKEVDVIYLDFRKAFDTVPHILYANSMPDIVQSKLFLDADDSKLFREISTTEDQRLLQQDLNSLRNRTKKSLLKFNRKKGVQMTLHSARRQPDSIYSVYSITGETLKKVSTEKDIRVEIDEQLNFDRQRAAKTKKRTAFLSARKKLSRT